MHIVLVPCASCGITFAVPREFFDARVADQRAFTCPNACPVRLGAASSTDHQVRALGVQVDRLQEQLAAVRTFAGELGAALAEARTMVDERGAEIRRLQQAVVEYELGPTAPVEGS